jgi:sulfur-oxidizing protein SoxX
MKFEKMAFFLVGLCIAISGCTNPDFNLPVGNEEAGRATFALLQCNECHSVEGVHYVGSEIHDINVKLGGPTTKVKTYADLVTSIINPSHKLSRGFDNNTVTTEGESQMRSYNEYMTVEELTDIVTFLESKYEIWVPTYYNY